MFKWLTTLLQKTRLMATEADLENYIAHMEDYRDDIENDIWRARQDLTVLRAKRGAVSSGKQVA